MKHVVGTIDWLVTGFFEIWLWFTIGLLGITAFFGRRLLKKWDLVTDSHMPDHEIEKKLGSIRDDMEECQTRLSDDQKTNYNKLNENIGEVHTRLDNLYELLLKRRR